MNSNLITLYGKRYTYKVGPFDTEGTEFYKDEAMTKLYCRTPWKCLFASQEVTLNGFRYFVKMK